MRFYLSSASQFCVAICMAVMCTAVSFAGFYAIRNNFDSIFEYRRLVYLAARFNEVEACLERVDNRVLALMAGKGDPALFADVARQLQNAYAVLDDANARVMLRADMAFVSNAQLSLERMTAQMRALGKALSELRTLHQVRALPAAKNLENALAGQDKNAVLYSLWMNLTVLSVSMEHMAAFREQRDIESLKQLQDDALDVASLAREDQTLLNNFTVFIGTFTEMATQVQMIRQDLDAYRAQRQTLLGDLEEIAADNERRMLDFGARLQSGALKLREQAYAAGTGCIIFSLFLVLIIGMAAFRGAPRSVSSAPAPTPTLTPGIVSSYQPPERPGAPRGLAIPWDKEWGRKLAVVKLVAVAGLVISLLLAVFLIGERVGNW